MNQNHVPAHRAGDPIPICAELGLMLGDHDVSVRTTETDPGTPAQYVTTATALDERAGQVLMVLSIPAASVLSQILTRFASAHHGPEVGMEDFDPSMWQHVAVDLLRHKALARMVPAGSPAMLYGGPRPCLVSVTP